MAPGAPGLGSDFPGGRDPQDASETLPPGHPHTGSSSQTECELNPEIVKIFDIELGKLTRFFVVKVLNSLEFFHGNENVELPRKFRSRM